MRTLKTEAARWLVVCGMLLLLLPVRTEAAEGDFSGYFANLTARLNQQVSAGGRGLSEAGLKNLLGDPAFLNTLCQRTLLAKYGVGNFEAFAKADPSNRTFLFWLLRNTEAMDLYLLGAAPVGLRQREANDYGLPGGSLDIWKRIYYADPESRDGLYLRLAIATSLNPPGTGNRGAGQAEKPAEPVDRYNHFKSAHQNGELLPSFDDLTVWDYRQVVSSNASDADLAWGREMVHTFKPELRQGEQVVYMTSQMVYQGSQIPYHDFSCVLAGGGKCGPRSSFGVFINQAFGIPAAGVGQPGHAAVAWRAPDGTWQIGYGRGWNVSKLLGLSGSEFLEGVAARSHRTQFSQVEHLRWLALALSGKEQSAAVLEIADKIAKAPPVVTASLRERPAPPKQPPAAKPEPPIPVVPGVIHVKAEDFFTRGGVHFYGGQHPSVPVIDCYTGGKQLHFQALMGEANVGYKINVPKTGIYELTARVATVNWGQNLYVRSFGAMLPVKEATASAVYHNMVKDLGPQQAIDNDMGTRWAVNEGADEAWLELDLGRPKTISKVMIDERTWNRVSKFVVEYKVGNDWKTIFEGTNIGIGYHKSFNPVTAQHVRLRTLDCRDAGGPTIWEFNVGTVNDGDAWINTDWTKGMWQTTKPVEIRLVQGPQTLWFCAPYQRGISFKWFELKPKTISRGTSTLSRPSQIKNP
jgi:hypothetical protein